MALINKPSYAELIESGSIDVAISPQTVTIGSLLAHVRRGDVVRVHSLRRGAAEALEVVVHRRCRQLQGHRPPHRGHQPCRKAPPWEPWCGVMTSSSRTTTPPCSRDDHLILFLTDRRHIDAVEKLFQGSASFL